MWACWARGRGRVWEKKLRWASLDKMGMEMERWFGPSHIGPRVRQNLRKGLAFFCFQKFKTNSNYIQT